MTEVSVQQFSAFFRPADLPVCFQTAYALKAFCGHHKLQCMSTSAEQVLR